MLQDALPNIALDYANKQVGVELKGGHIETVERVPLFIYLPVTPFAPLHPL